ncbi:MAG TPA: invasin domain 3-containing protein, partial [Longimicrobium sp.]
MAAAAWFAAASALSAQQPATDPLRGDVDGDGAVTAADARIVADYLVGRPVPAGANVRDRGDVNGDGRVTSVDAAIIRGFVAGRANVGRFKVGAPVSDADNALARVRCRVDARTATMTCGGPADQPGGPRSSLTLTYGGQGQFVTLASTPGVATPYSGGDSVEVTSDVTVRNLLPQKIGTPDGVTNDSVRVFFSMAPTTTSGSGTVTVDGAGLGTFTAGNQRYYSYAGPIDTQAVSAPRQWRFKMPATVTVFDFELLVDADVQYNGWVDLYPPYHKPSPYIVPVDTLMPGETLQLVDSVRSAKGFHLPGIVVSNWSSNNPAAATVSSSGFVTAVDVGTTTVTATAAGSRTGQVSIVVARPDTATSTITAAPATVPVGDSSTVTVQLKYTSGGNVSRSGGTVALSASAGGTITAVTNNNNGTYTAKVTSTTAGLVTVSGTLDGHTLVDTAGVTFTAGAPTGMAANPPAPASATVGTAVAAPPSVKITDAHGNGVAGVAVTFTVTTGSGQVSNGTDPAGASAVVTTNASGVATLASWTLGTTAGTDNNSVTASATGLTDVVFTVSATVGAAANMAAASVTTQSAEVNTAVAAPPSVTVTDQYGNVVPGYTVTFTVAAGGGQVSNGTDPAGASAAVVTNASGVATLASWTVGTAVGTDNNTVTASGTGVTDVGFTASGTPGAVHHFVVEAAAGGNIGDQLAGAAFNVKVTAQDQFNNTATGFTGTVDFTTTPPGGITAGGTSAAFTAGVLSSHAVTIGTPGDYTLTATRTGGTEAGSSNQFQVQQAPTAVADGPTPTSVPGDPYHAAFNTALGATNVMTNDTRGLPLANVTSFGGGSAGGDVTTNAPGAVVNLGNGGSLTVAADGAVTFTPSTGFTGLFTFQYRITNVRGTSDAQVTIAVGFRPAVTNDLYPANLLGNVPISTVTSTGFNVTTNDVGDAKVLTPGPATNGVVALNANGTFTFTPSVGFTGGNATFTYTVTNGFGTTEAATVTLPVSGIAWFVNTAADGGNDGRFGSAFDNLNNAFPAGAGKPAADQPIFVYSGSYTGGVALLNGQRLVGQGATGTDFASVMGVSWPADAGPQPGIGGTRPSVASGLTLGNGNTLQGFNLTGSATALAGTNFGTLTVSEVGINTSGQALSLNNGTLAGGGFTQVRSTGGATNVSLTNVATSVAQTLGTNADVLQGATLDGFVISGGNGSFTYAGTIANTAANRVAVNVSGKTGGSVTFSGDINPVTAANGISVTGNNSGTNTITFSGANKKISAAGSNTGVNLANNTGATIAFTNGGLAISTASGTGFNATGGGEVTVGTGAVPNTVASTGGGRVV